MKFTPLVLIVAGAILMTAGWYNATPAEVVQNVLNGKKMTHHPRTDKEGVEGKFYEKQPDGSFKPNSNTGGITVVPTGNVMNV